MKVTYRQRIREALSNGPLNKVQLFGKVLNFIEPEAAVERFRQSYQEGRETKMALSEQVTSGARTIFKTTLWCMQRANLVIVDNDNIVTLVKQVERVKVKRAKVERPKRNKLCKNGHPQTEENLYRRADGQRERIECRICMRAQWQRKHERDRQKKQRQNNIIDIAPTEMMSDTIH